MALDPKIVEEFVGSAHGDLERVQELLGQEPGLVNAAWDWGGGDWETSLGAAAHMGRRDIAEYLLGRGARMDIFAAAMLGKVEIVRALVADTPSLKDARGPHGIPLLAHAKAGGADAAAVVVFLESPEPPKKAPSILERYRELYEHEKDCDQKMLAMLESVPEANRGDARFQRAVTLAGHLVACRENWLDRMDGKGNGNVPWWDNRCELSTLRPRFTAVEGRWTDYLARLDEDRLPQGFEFAESPGERFTLPTEVQIVQLIGHAPYHRGQVALLVDQLGGETVDTDYADWWWANRRDR